MRTLPLLLLSGCVIGGNKYPTAGSLTPSWLVDRVRILAVAANPPEVPPGTLVAFDALVVDPTSDTTPDVLWLACPPTQAGSFGCNVDFTKIDFAHATPAELAAAGVIGFTPGFSPTYTPDATLLDGLSDSAQLEGVDVTIEVAAFQASFLDTLQADTGSLAVDTADTGQIAGVDYSKVDIGYKRLVVSTATTPNHNPAIAGWTVDNHLVTPGAVVEMDAGQNYAIGILLAAGAVEDYDYLDSKGVVEHRVEEPYVDFYTTSGTMEQSLNLYPNLFVTYDTDPAAKSGSTGTWWAVVRDRRGGMSWIAQSFTIR